MSALTEIVQKINAAWDSKDEATMREYLHEDYRFRGPMMEINNVDECIEFMKSCPFEGGSENVEMITEGNRVVQVMDWVVTTPFQATISIVEIIDFEGEKVKNSRMFFDTAAFPAEFIAQMEEMNKNAA